MNEIIRPFETDDLSPVMQLYGSCFPGHTSNRFVQSMIREQENVFDWKYKQPGSERYVAELDGSIVGFLGKLGRTVTREGVDLSAQEGVDRMVHPSYRKKGLGTKMEEYAISMAEQSDTSISIGFPNKMALELYGKIGNPNLLQDIPIVGKETTKKSSENVHPLERFTETEENFFMDMSPDLGTTTKRTKDYLNWRLIDNPLYNYSVFIERKPENDDVLGYVSLKEYFDGEKVVGTIVDIVSSSEETSSNLLNFSEKFFSNKGIDKMVAYCFEDSALADHFQDHGFETIGIRSLEIAPFSEQASFVLSADEIKKWHLTMMDHDVI